MAKWYESFFDGLYAKVLPKHFDETATLEQARTIKRILRLRKGQRALDIPCGMGRLTLPLARMGVLMTGVDLTRRYVERARAQTRKEKLSVRLVCQDMRAIDFDGEFDAAFNWFTSFGYFSDADNLEFCQRVLRALKPGGRFLVEGINKSWLLTHFSSRVEETVGTVSIVHESRWNSGTERIRSVWTMHRGRTTERHTISHKLYNGTDLRRLLRTAGFREIKLFGSPPLGRLTRHSQRLIAVARRPWR
jgi:SAM-dependent methyltransferase